MKFTDGNWMMREGVRPHYPAQAYETETDAHALTVFAPSRHVHNRGGTLDGPLLAVQLTSPLPDVIRVRFSHFAVDTETGPHFPLFGDDDTPISIVNTDTEASLTSGQLTGRIAKEGGWRLTFEANGKVITQSDGKGLGYMNVAGEGAFVQEQLSLGVGECVYGLGERFTAFVKNGQVVDTWNKDGGTGSDQAYKNVPFYLTNKGYGVFVNHPEQVSFEIASEKVSRVQFSVPGRFLEYFIIYGPTPKEVLAKYTALTGRPALPPAWSFGLWLTTSFTTSYDESTVTSFIQGMADRDLPLHVFHFDCFWMREYHWCDFQWDTRVFPHPAEMLARLKERGLKICVWINPYIAQRSRLFEEARANGYLLKKPNGEVWQTDQWQAGMGIVDFTNPAACQWYAGYLRELLDQGVDCFKTDFGERIPTDVTYFDGSDPVKMHNFYSYLYNQTVFDVLTEKRGEGDAVLFARSGTAGCQQFPVHWGGDCYSSFESMAESLRGGLSLSLSGFGFWSHDIGGFEGTPPAEVYKRWIAFGLLSSHSRLHGSSSYRVPWMVDEESVDTLRFFTKLKCRLMPYLFAQAQEAHTGGIPTLRAMLLEFPNDPACDTLDRQYLLGESLLVAPVFSTDNIVDYYLPPGQWTNFITGKAYSGPGWVRESHGFLSIPLMVRPNSVIAVGGRDDKPDYDYTEGTTYQVYALEDGQSVTTIVPNLSGSPALQVVTERQGEQITVSVEGDAKGWQVLLVGIFSVASVTGGSSELSEQGMRIQPEDGAKAVQIRLD